jgi:hypothetical protein
MMRANQYAAGPSQYEFMTREAARFVNESADL